VNDDFHPQGCAMGFLIAGLLWIVIFVVLALIVTFIARHQ
jgi:hypothetical protein